MHGLHMIKKLQWMKDYIWLTMGFSALWMVENMNWIVFSSVMSVSDRLHWIERKRKITWQREQGKRLISFYLYSEFGMYTVCVVQYRNIDLNYSEVTQVKYLHCQYCFPEVSRFLILSTTSIWDYSDALIQSTWILHDWISNLVTHILGDYRG